MKQTSYERTPQDMDVAFLNLNLPKSSCFLHYQLIFKQINQLNKRRIRLCNVHKKMETDLNHITAQIFDIFYNNCGSLCFLRYTTSGLQLHGHHNMRVIAKA